MSNKRGPQSVWAMLGLICIAACDAGSTPAKDGGDKVAVTSQALTPATFATPIAPRPSSAAGRTIALSSVDTNGQPHYSIPLVLPPGVRDVAPELSLEYDPSSTAGSQLGVGWALGGLTAITRCPRTWTQDGEARAVSGDVNDRFCLDGQRLQLDSGTYGAAGATYRTEIESFMRVTAFNEPSTIAQHFRGFAKDKRVFYYGADTSQKVLFPGTGIPRVWPITRIETRDFRAIDFTYTRDPSSGSYRPNTISYGPYMVRFSYETRPSNEVDSGYVAGALIRDVVRLRQINIVHGTTPVRSYLLDYESSLSSARNSRLASVTECAGTNNVCLEPTRFRYQDGTPALGDSVSIGSVPTLPLVIDVNGDGRDDLVYTSDSFDKAGTWRYRLATSAGGFAEAVDTGIPNANYFMAVPIDYNDDGRRDVMVPIGQTWKVLLGGPQGLTGFTDSLVSCVSPGPTQARAYDVNGDGLEDLVTLALTESGTTSAVTARYRSAGGGFEPSTTRLFSLPEEDIISNAFEAGGRLSARAPDFDGDGRGDLLIVSFRILSGPTLVHTLTSVLSSGSTNVLDNFYPGTVQDYGDWNGDGKTDIAYFDNQERILVLLSKGTSFTQPFLIGSAASYLQFPRMLVMDWDGDGNDDLLLPNRVTGSLDVARSNGDNLTAPVSTGVSVSFGDQPTIGDINGDGLGDLVQSAAGVSAYRLHRGVYPDLLSSATDGHGNVTSFEYGTAVEGAAYTRHSGASFPEQDFAGPLRIVTRTRLPDGNGGQYAVDYSYAGARVQRQGRGFEGFASRTSRDARSGERIVESFKQAFPYTGLTTQRDVLQADGQPVERTSTSWVAHAYASGRSGRFFPYAATIARQSYEVGGARSGSLLTAETTTQAVDITSGTPLDTTTTTTEAPSANGIQPGASFVDRLENPIAQLYNDTTNWCLGRPDLTRSTRSHNQFGGAASTRTEARNWRGSNYSCRATRVVLEPDHPTLRLVIEHRTTNGNVTVESYSGPAIQGRRFDATWSSNRFPTSTTNPLQEISLHEWNPISALLIKTTDPNGLSTSYAHDDFGRLTRETRPDGTTRTLAYEHCSVYGCLNANNRMVVVIRELDASGSPITEQLLYTDRFDRLIANSQRTMSGEYSRSDIEYDAHNRPSRVSAPCWKDRCTPAWTSFAYDTQDRIVSITAPTSESDPTPRVARVFYEGLTTRFVDERDKQTTRIDSATGTLARSIDHDGYYQQFDYDAFDNPVRVTDSLGNTLQTLRYNERGMKIEQLDMDSGRHVYVPNALGELESYTSPKGHKFSFVLDQLGRVRSRIEPAGNTLFTWGTSAADKNIGRLVSVKRNNDVYIYSNFSYDAFGRLASRTFSTRSDTSPGTYKYSYNSAGLVDTLTYPHDFLAEFYDQSEVVLKYDYSAGKLQQIANASNPAEVFWRADRTDPAERIIDETAGDGVRTERRFDQVTGDLLSIRNTNSTGALIGEQQYAWDRVGNLLERSDPRQGLREMFRYDNLYRLTRSTLNDQVNLELTYDALGNISSKSDVGAYTYDPVRKHAVVNAGGTAYGYDANGNVIARGGAAISWTSYNLPTRIDGAGGDFATFEYDAERNLTTVMNFPIGSVFPSERTTMIGDLLERYLTASGPSHFRSRILGPNGTVAVVDRTAWARQTHYLGRDHLQSVDSSRSQSGEVEARSSFSAFGQPRDGTSWSGPQSAADAAKIRSITDLGYAGHFRIDLVNAIHMGGRVYDPILGRFLSPDPFIDGVGETQGWNRYSYVANNPLTNVDPSGYGLFNFRFSFKGLLQGLASVFLKKKSNGGGLRCTGSGELCRRAQNGPGPSPDDGTMTRDPNRPVIPPPRPEPLQPSKGPLRAQTFDPAFLKRSSPPQDFIDDTPEGFRLNRERYNIYLTKLFTRGKFPTTAAKRQRQLYEAVTEARDAFAQLKPEDLPKLFAINSTGKSYLTTVQLELIASLEELQRKLAPGAAVSGALQATSRMGLVRGELNVLATASSAADIAKGNVLSRFLTALDLLVNNGFEIECGNELTAPRFGCIVRQTTPAPRATDDD